MVVMVCGRGEAGVHRRFFAALRMTSVGMGGVGGREDGAELVKSSGAEGFKSRSFASLRMTSSIEQT